jgi:hypothetical protein
MDTKTRLLKAINFFRTFSDRSDKELYRKSVLKFCDMVEEFIADAPENKTYEDTKKLFDDKS